MALLFKRILVAFAFIILTFTLQFSFFKWLAFNNAVPNLIIIECFLFGIALGRKAGMIIGMLSGLLIDCFYCPVFGINTFVLLLIGYFCGFLGHTLFDDDIKLQLLLIVLVDFIYSFINYVIWFLLQGRIDVGYYFYKVILPELIYTFIVAAILYYPLKKLIKHVFITKDTRETKKIAEKY